MCLGSSPKAPAPPPVLPAAPTPPASASLAGEPESADVRRRARGAKSGAGQTGTILTGPRGLQEPPQVATKTLLGA